MDVSKKVIQLSKSHYVKWSQSTCDYNMSKLYERSGNYVKAKSHVKRALKARLEIYGTENNRYVRLCKEQMDDLNMTKRQ